MSPTDQSSPDGRTLRFGVFEVDLAAGLLRKRGRRVKLEAQPFQVLTILLRRPGELVTRDELQKALWPQDTFVEFDHSLNTAVKKIRQALDDSPRTPRCIETVPRQGYRFIAAVESCDEDRADAEGAEKSRPLGVWVVGAVAVVVVAGWIAWLSEGRSETPGTIFKPVPLTAYPGRESDPSFSPDGSQVAFSWDGEREDNYDIYVKLVDSGRPDRLTADPGDDVGPAWSPDGRHIAFYRRTRDGGAVYLVSSRGGSERKLVDLHNVPPWTYRLSWSPDGKLLAFQDVMEFASEGSKIFLLTIDTLQKQELPIRSTEIVHFRVPAFSPDGETIAFVANDSTSSTSPSDIYLVPATGGRPSRLTTVNDFIHGLAWTADGDAIVFCSGTSYRNSVLSKVRSAGGRVDRFVQFGENALAPAISPDGRRLLYVYRTLDTNVWRFDALDGSPARKLIASTRRDGSASYSPDGKRLVTRSDRSGDWELWSYDSEGSNPVQLTTLEGPFIGFPSWSPDGAEIAFDCQLKEGNWDICVVKAEGGAPRLATSHAALDARPSWSRDGRWIYFTSERTGAGQVWKVPTEGGEPVVVTNDGGWNPVESPDGRWLYYSKGRSIRRIPTEGGEETLVLDDYSRALWGNWAPVDEGIWFAELADGKGSIKFLSFDTGRVEQNIPIGDFFHAGRLSVSPDRRWILFNQLDRIDEDLMLVEDFQ